MFLVLLGYFLGRLFFVKRDKIIPKRIILAVWATYKKRLLHKNFFSLKMWPKKLKALPVTNSETNKMAVTNN